MNRIGAAIVIALCWAQSASADTGFSTENASALLRKLSVEIGPRPMGSPAEREALEFAAAKLREYGCDTSYVLPMTQTSAVNTSSGVAVGILRGKTGRMIVLGGHIDSAGPEIPGANDDGSGSAVVLEAARVLAGRELESTIVFALFGGEEQGLEGSEFFVKRFEPLDSVVMMLQVDMASGLGTLIMDPNSHGPSAPAWLVRATVEEFENLAYSGLVYPLHYFGWNYSLPSGSGSDHEPFLRAGIPAIDFTTDIDDPIHTQRDTYQNFDPAGLKRSGDLVIRLVERFDGGTPDRTTADYWLYLLPGYPLILPIPAIWAFIILSPLLGLFVLVRLRRSHLVLKATEGYVERKWTSVKFWLISVISVALGWMTPDLIGFLKALRFPWYAHLEYYYVPSILASVFGLLAGARLASALKISASPYVLFKRSFIILVLLTFLAAAVGVKIAVAPALCLVLLSVGMLLRWPVPATLAALLAPIWLFRLFFSEADSLLFRFTAPQLPATTGLILAINAGWIVVLSVLVVSWLPGAAAVIRRRENPWTFIGAVKARRFMVITAGLYGISILLLLVVPSYERPWYPRVQIEQIDLPGVADDTVSVRGSEYLTDAVIRHGSVDTLIGKRTLRYVGRIGFADDTRWLDVTREVTPRVADSSTAYDVLLGLRTPFRPYTVSVFYSSARGNPTQIATALRTRSSAGGTKISWYSFPDTLITLPARFLVAAGDTLREEITVTFDSLMAPVDFRYRESDVTRRTVVREMRFYPGPEAKAGGEGTR